MTIIQHNRFLIKLSVSAAKTCLFILLYAVIIFGILSLQFNNFVPNASPARPLPADNRSQQNADTLTFDALVRLDLASENTFRVTENTLADLLITAFEAGPATNELFIVAYLAAMGERNSLDQALSRLPGTLTADTDGRSYVSSPYLDNLADIYPTLEAEDAAFRLELRAAIGEQNLAFFTREGIAESLLRCDDRDGMNAFLLLPTTLAGFDPTVTEAAAILEVYSVFTASNSSYASLLEPATEKCLATILGSGTLRGDRFLLSDDAGPLSAEAAVRIGAALMQYSEAKQQPLYMGAGHLLVNSVCSGAETSFSPDTLSRIYFILNSRGRFTPHTQLLAELPGGPLWAWTVAETITYSTDALRRVTITINYPRMQFHHLIIHGLSPFSTVEIQGFPWRSDPRFETYGASGYTYDAESRTLLLRMLQSNPAEIVRFTY